MPDQPATRSPRRTSLLYLGLLMLTLGGLAWQARPDGRLHLRFPAVDGDATIVQLPSGDTLLIDGGASPSALSAALGQAMPYWQRSLQAVVLTSASARHVPGQVDALAHYRALAAYAAPDAASARSATAREWRRLLAEQRTPIRTLRAGQRIDLGDGVRLIVLAAGEGALLRIEYGSTSAVLAQSSPAEGEGGLAQAGRLRPAQLAVFPWERDPRTALMQALRPAAVIYSDGFQSDHPALLSYAERRVGREALYHERVNAALEWVSDGRHSWILSENS
jgi:hypothetical protein